MPSSPSTELYRLPAIPYLRLSVTLRALAPACLPAFKGSTLRGAFGHALRRSVCAMGPEQPCESCRLRRACVYTRIFETFVEAEPPPFLRGLATAPRPYVFEPATEERSFVEGDALDFDLLLFGQAVELQAYVLLAVERLAAAGLGRDRAPFTLARAEAHEPAGGRRLLIETGRARDLTGVPPSLPPAGPSLGRRVTLRFLTPTRIKVRNQLAATVDFRSLVFNMLRRTLEVAHFHVPGAAIDWNFRSLLDCAAAIRVAGADLTWRDWDRYSNRQQTKMTLGGLVGTLALEGDLHPFASLLNCPDLY